MKLKVLAPSSLLLIMLQFSRIQSACAQGTDFDQPNVEFENRLNQIYENYYSRSMDSDKWQSMLGAHKSEVYTIQKGDTLWNLSETLFGDGQYWPKLWAENRNIENPHELLKNMQVRFFAGNLAQGPSFMMQKPGESAPLYVEDAKIKISEADKNEGVIIEDPDVIGRKPDIPESTQVTAPPLKYLPSSFKDPKVSNDKMYDQTGLDVGIPRVLKEPNQITLNSYISDGVPRKLGFVKEIEIQDQTASVLQSVYVELGRKVQIGEKLNVVTEKSELKYNDEILGHIIEVGGCIQITEVVSDEDGIYKALVTESVGPIQKNAAVTDEPHPHMIYSAEGSQTHVEGNIVGGEYDADRKILASGAVVYLNIGSENGLHEGDLLSVRSQRLSRKPDTNLEHAGRTIGTLKVAKLTSRTATAVIVNSIDEIRPGDKTGGEFLKEFKNELKDRKKIIDVDQMKASDVPTHADQMAVQLPQEADVKSIEEPKVEAPQKSEENLEDAMEL